MLTKLVNGVEVVCSTEEEAALQAEWSQGETQIAADTAERLRLQGIREDALRQQLQAQLDAATAAQISSFVDNQVTDLASARLMFKRILLLLGG